MCDHHKSGAALAGQLQHQRKHAVGRFAVQVARGLVGQHTGRVVDQGAGQGHTLALATRQLRGAVVQALTQAHALQPARGHGSGLGAVLAANPQRHGHVVQGAELGQQMVELVDKAQVAVAPLALLGRAQGRQQLALQLHRTLGGGIEATEQMQQGAFARARSAHDGQRLARVHGQVHALQHRHIQPPFGKALGQALGLQHHRVLHLIHSAAPPQG